MSKVMQCYDHIEQYRVHMQREYVTVNVRSAIALMILC
jgi:hypothetical protein